MFDDKTSGIEGDSVDAAKAGQMMSFEIEAGDGLTAADAADLTFILRKVSISCEC